MTKEEKTKKIATISSAMGTLGMVGGLYFAYTRQNKFWGYVGWALLFSFGASAISGAVSSLAIKEDSGTANKVIVDVTKK